MQIFDNVIDIAYLDADRLIANSGTASCFKICAQKNIHLDLCFLKRARMVWFAVTFVNV